MKIKTGDNVRIMVGKDKGKEGKVIQAFPELNKVVVEGLNQRVKHIKPRGTQAGQRVTFSAPMNASNVQIAGKEGVGRVGYAVRDGRKIRVLKHKKSTEELG